MAMMARIPKLRAKIPRDEAKVSGNGDQTSRRMQHPAYGKRKKNGMLWYMLLLDW